MSDDCYWKHGAPVEKRFPCFDRKNTVCPFCCVKKCPTETPLWFGACTAAGHPTWSKPTIPVPRKLVCLESSWDDRVFQHLYRFYTHADPWGHLSEIFNSVKQDIGPAERMGYTLFQLTQG